MTLDYKTALALKNAGFPPSMESHALFINSTEVIAPRGRMEDLLDDFAYLPSLEEIIEALGDDFGELYPIHNYKGNIIEWRASGGKFGKDITKVVVEKTSKIAVARLYLALHSKE